MPEILILDAHPESSIPSIPNLPGFRTFPSGAKFENLQNGPENIPPAFFPAQAPSLIPP